MNLITVLISIMLSQADTCRPGSFEQITNSDFFDITTECINEKSPNDNLYWRDINYSDYIKSRQYAEYSYFTGVSLMESYVDVGGFYPKYIPMDHLKNL